MTLAADRPNSRHGRGLRIGCISLLSQDGEDWRMLQSCFGVGYLAALLRSAECSRRASSFSLKGSSLAGCAWRERLRVQANSICSAGRCGSCELCLFAAVCQQRWVPVTQDRSRPAWLRVQRCRSRSARRLAGIAHCIQNGPAHMPRNHELAALRRNIEIGPA